MANPLTSSAPQSAAPFRQTRFAGLRFTLLDVDETVAALAARPASDHFAAFVTPNAEHAYLRRHDEEFRLCGDTCWISTNDSRVLGGAARLAGIDLKFAPGAYVVDRIFRGSVRPDDAITVLGGTREMVDKLRNQFGLTCVAHHIPPMGFIDKPEAVDAAIAFVVAHPARFVFVAMGPPQSEKFCQRVIADGRATGIGLCIGSAINVITGQSQPAPAWMERAGLVWLYRLVKEPRRLWRRYLLRGLVGLGLGLRDAAAIRLGLRPGVSDAV